MNARAVLDRILVGDECWEWSGHIDAKGYGHYGSRLAHRVVYELLAGPIPDGLTLDHLCRNRRCVRPRHLEPVPLRENLRRGQGASAKNAVKTHCVNGHELTPENLYIVRGWRVCRACDLARARQYRARRKER